MIFGRTAEESLALVEVAQGRRPADFYIENGRVVNVYSGEVLEANVAVCGRFIAYVGGSRIMRGAETEIIDASGYYLVPGYIDPHFHPDCYYNPYTGAIALLPHGTTTIFSNSSYLARTLSTEGFESSMADLARLPVKCFTGIPEQKFFFPQLEDYTWEEFDRLLDNPDSFGYNEVGVWTRFLEGDDMLLRKVLLARSKGKKVDGHTAGCSYDKLNVMAVGGLTSCHESLSAQDALDRLRLGFWVMLRESTNRRDLERLLPIITRDKVSTARLLLTADGLTAPELVNGGHMDALIRKAISFGVEPATAYRIASLNAATYHGLDGALGGIGPGRLADIAFLRDLEEPTPAMVMANGSMAARNGEVVIDFPQPRYYSYARNRHREPGLINEARPDMFLVPASAEEVRFPVMHVLNAVVNRRRDQVLRAGDGYLWADAEADLLKVAMVNRQAGEVTTTFMSGFGARVGGIASTMNSAYQIVVAGYSDEDMALAVNRVLELGGGVVIAEAGAVVQELPLPLGGLMSVEPVAVLAKKVAAMNQYLSDMGIKLGDPYYFFSFLPSSFFPDLRVTTEGLYDVKKAEVLIPPRRVA